MLNSGYKLNLWLWGKAFNSLLPLLIEAVHKYESLCRNCSCGIGFFQTDNRQQELDVLPEQDLFNAWWFVIFIVINGIWMSEWVGSRVSESEWMNEQMNNFKRANNAFCHNIQGWN